MYVYIYILYDIIYICIHICMYIQNIHVSFHIHIYINYLFMIFMSRQHVCRLHGSMKLRDIRGRATNLCSQCIVDGQYVPHHPHTAGPPLMDSESSDSHEEELMASSNC